MPNTVGGIGDILAQLKEIRDQLPSIPPLGLLGTLGARRSLVLRPALLRRVVVQNDATNLVENLSGQPDRVSHRLCRSVLNLTLQLVTFFTQDLSVLLTFTTNHLDCDCDGKTSQADTHPRSKPLC